MRDSWGGSNSWRLAARPIRKHFGKPNVFITPSNIFCCEHSFNIGLELLSPFLFLKFYPFFLLKLLETSPRKRRLHVLLLKSLIKTLVDVLIFWEKVVLLQTCRTSCPSWRATREFYSGLLATIETDDIYYLSMFQLLFKQLKLRNTTSKTSCRRLKRTFNLLLMPTL